MRNSDLPLSTLASKLSVRGPAADRSIFFQPGHRTTTTLLHRSDDPIFLLAEHHNNKQQ